MDGRCLYICNPLQNTGELAQLVERTYELGRLAIKMGISYVNIASR